MLHNAKTHYGLGSRIFHWGGALLIVALFTIAYLMMDMAPDPQKWALYDYHKSFGLLALVWAVARLSWRSMQIHPDPTSSDVRINYAANLMHMLLYVLMLAMPLSGYVMSVAGGHNVFFFGFPMPNLFEHNPIMAGRAHMAHEYISYALMVCVAFHVIAALWHHLVWKDNTLRRMVKSR